MSLMVKFGEGVGRVILPMVERKIDEFGKKLLDIAGAKLDEMSGRALALIPLAGATVVKQALEAVPGLKLPEDFNAADLAEVARGDLNKIPDIDIPLLSDIFDLTEFLKGFGKPRT
ncbi:hypothetical protein SEA_CLARKSON_53 [Mycobacterium phage Clarkson]|uniref:Uncharacterized protein n=3 Tax=Marvinvirus marvin TaxID=1982092 RepID=A0A5P8D652_9CAUD|nr:hypothetical protein SEA_JOIEB_53 [Mycobacterium phage JoieB]QFP97606.1 hypothetical protein SEA_CORAZON_50 [Mycobacterium phage Corazon]URP22545.1 hypothetical protein SEA_HUPHLEPUFF_54 [Mycobacterium phage Huphlepuff]WAA20157.1 hypothetical protein SEA_CLARKSON_53 [Mycobacterium phage Clarkson]